jgi:hypothetical protein
LLCSLQQRQLLGAIGSATLSIGGAVLSAGGEILARITSAALHRLVKTMRQQGSGWGS